MPVPYQFMLPYIVENWPQYYYIQIFFRGRSKDEIKKQIFCSGFFFTFSTFFHLPLNKFLKFNFHSYFWSHVPICHKNVAYVIRKMKFDLLCHKKDCRMLRIGHNITEASQKYKYDTKYPLVFQSLVVFIHFMIIC